MANDVTSGWKSADPVLTIFGSEDERRNIVAGEAKKILDCCDVGIIA